MDKTEYGPLRKSLRKAGTRMPITDGRIQRSKYIGRSKVVTEVEVKRVYERLRKASYRGKQYHYMAEVTHQAYVAGVRDALKEIL